MPFDGLVLAAVRKELEHKLTGGRIERIYQPQQEELVLSVHRPGARYRLLISASSQNARVHLTTATRENPAAPPLYCMVLRKHLEGGRIAGFEQAGLERVLVMKVESRDELGRASEKHLVCEIMGKHSNIILMDPSTGTIIDGIKRYSHAVSRYREVLPGKPYVFPPSQGKLDPFSVNEEQFSLACLESPLETALPQLLQKRFEGLSTVTCREIVYRAGLPLETLLDQCGEYELRVLWQSFSSFMAKAAQGSFEPCLTAGKKGEFLDFAAVNLTHTGEKIMGGEMNTLLNLFYTAREQLEKLNKTRNSVISLLNKEMARLEKKLDLYAKSLDETAGAEKFRLYGELLTANLYRLEKGCPEAVLENYYDERRSRISIPLDPQLTPAENAQAYFKKYSKAKNTRQALEALAARAREELAYLEEVKTAVEMAAGISELDEIKQELAEQGYLKQPAPEPGARKTKKERQVPSPLSFVSTDGFQIFIGRNNKQNDYLTQKIARDNDIWLHARDIPGAHVIIKTEGKEVPPATLEEAAGLAAYFSKGRNSKIVPVDYTFKKHVRKPKGARPGMVVYDHQKTIMAAPAGEAAERLNFQQPGGNDTG